MKVLVLGGTKFLGRHIIETASECGHDITMFNRGRSGPELYPAVSRLSGDRDGDVHALSNGEWDAAIDFSGFLPRQISAVARLLQERVGRYVFMSSIAVYARTDLFGMTEAAPLLRWEDGSPEVWSMDDYGALKTGCEREVERSFPGRSACVRSGFILGRYGPDLGSWGTNLAAGLDIRCSLRPEQPIQVLDAGDLARFMLRLAGSGPSGPVNVVGPTVPVGQVAAAWCSAVPGTQIRWERDGDDLGLSSEASQDGTFRISNAKAVGAGLRIRDMSRTARDYVDWIRSGAVPPPPPH